MGRIHREALHGRAGGIWCRPKKTRHRRKSVFVPLRTADGPELDANHIYQHTLEGPRAVYNGDLVFVFPTRQALHRDQPTGTVASLVGEQKRACALRQVAGMDYSPSCQV